MRNQRQTSVRRAILRVLSLMPEGIVIPDRLLRADAQRLVLPPAPTTAKLDAEIQEADTARLIVSVNGEDDVQRQITDAGRAWLARNP